MKVITIRGVSTRLAEELEREKRRRGRSLNQTVLDLLSDRLGVDDAGPRRNGLARLSGTWSSENARRFEHAVASTRQVDDELWR
jgi:hypothetical protein